MASYKAQAVKPPPYLQGVGQWIARVVRAYPTEWAMLAALIGLLVFLSLTASQFATAHNFINVMQEAAPIGILAVGQTFVILTAGIDLSVGSIFGFTSIVGGSIMLSHGLGPGVVAALAIGAGIGLLNGTLISYAGLPAFIVTLAGLAAFSSWTQVFSNGNSVTGLPNSLGSLTNDSIGIVPIFVPLTLALYIFAQWTLIKTRFGRFIYAVGYNPEAARFSGVNVKFYKAIPYVISGFLAALAGLVAASQLLSVDPAAGEGLELSSIAAVVIGGTSLFGGRGTIAGTLIGTLFVAYLANGLNLLGVNPFWQGSATGAVIVFAVGLERLVNRNRD